MNIFILAIQFMTTIPININLEIEREDFHKTVKYFPIIGLIIGIFESLIYYLSIKIFPNSISSYLVIFFHFIITGGMHIDGLSDSADGLFSGRNRQRILEIMKDSRIGTFGAVSIVLLTLIKSVAISEIPRNKIINIIIIAPIISRTMNILLMYKRKYARDVEGMGDLFIGVVEKKDSIICFTLGLLISFIVYKQNGIMIFFISFIFTLLFRNYSEKKIGGVTGDILGASNELNELIIYMIGTIL